MSTKVVGLVDCFNLPTFGPLTKHRLRASTVFLPAASALRQRGLRYPISGIPEFHRLAFSALDISVP